jgi:MCP family monocarboxylic acid transporter-like MFS transporter 10
VSTRSARRVGRGGQASGLTLGWNCAATTFAPLIVFALVMGLCSGGWTSLYSAIIKSLVGMLSRSQVYLAHSILLEFTHDPRSSAFQRTTPVSPRTSSRPSPSRAGSALLCAPIASALISHPFSSASAKTGYGVSDGKYGGVVLFAGLAMGVGAGLEAVEWLLSSPKRVA